MIVVLRHGERADNSPFEIDQKLVKYSFDPHLTELGLQQSEQCGIYMEKMLLKINPRLEEIVMISSPFLRCIQTADTICKNFRTLKVSHQCLFAQSHIGEMLRSSWFSEDVNSLLTLYTNKNEIESLIKLPVKTPFLADQRLIEQMYPENKLGDFYDRFKIAYELLQGKFKQDYDQEKTAMVLVTHGFGVQVVLDSLDAFNYLDMVDYCSINIIDYRNNQKNGQNKPNICVQQFHQHLKEADVNHALKREIKSNM